MEKLSLEGKEHVLSDDTFSALTKKKFRVISFSVGCPFLVIGIVGFAVFPLVHRSLLQRGLALREENERYEKWKQIPVPILFKVFLFNVTNPREVINGTKPILQEVGPYIFKEKRSREVVSWNNNNLTVTYDDFKQYHFVEEESADMSNKIYTLNMPLQASLLFKNTLSPIYQTFINNRLQNYLDRYDEHLFTYRTARELMFEGYKLDFIQDIMDVVSHFSSTPNTASNITYSYFYGRNNSGDGRFEINTGIDDIGKHLKIVKWNNMSKLPFWNDEYCNMINGTDATQFPPLVSKGDILHLYAPEFCRSVSLEYKEDAVVEKIPVLRFIPNKNDFKNPSNNPDNKCFYQTEYTNLSGIFDVAPCNKNLKLVVTGVHFINAHESVQQSVEGLHPSEELHTIFLDIEPTTGAVLRASKKIQFNYLLDKHNELKEMKNIRKCFLPLFWATEETSIDSENADYFISTVLSPVTTGKALLITATVIGAILTVTAGFATAFVLVKKKNIHSFT